MTDLVYTSGSVTAGRVSHAASPHGSRKSHRCIPSPLHTTSSSSETSPMQKQDQLNEIKFTENKRTLIVFSWLFLSILLVRQHFFFSSQKSVFFCCWQNLSESSHSQFFFCQTPDEVTAHFDGPLSASTYFEDTLPSMCERRHSSLGKTHWQKPLPWSHNIICRLAGFDFRTPQSKYIYNSILKN